MNLTSVFLLIKDIGVVTYKREYYHIFYLGNIISYFTWGFWHTTSFKSVAFEKRSTYDKVNYYYIRPQHNQPGTNPLVYFFKELFESVKLFEEKRHHPRFGFKNRSFKSITSEFKKQAHTCTQ